MGVEFQDEKPHEKEDREDLELLITQLNGEDPERAEAAQKELEAMMSIYRVLYIQLNSTISTTKTAFGVNDEDLEMKRRQRKVWEKRIEMIRNALNLKKKKSLPVFNLKPLWPQRPKS